MSCDQFQQRMDWLLDQRQDVNGDAVLSRHAETCSACRERLLMWSRIDEFVSPDPVTRSDHVLKLPLMRSALATAAAILLFATLNPSSPIEQTNTNSIASVIDMPPKSISKQNWVPPAEVTKNPAPLASAATGQQFTWQSPQWWMAMSDDQWVNHTMPAVTSVRLGIAPIGRSMKQALSILMIQSDSKQINPSAVTPTANPNRFEEQSSSDRLLQHFVILT